MDTMFEQLNNNTRQIKTLTRQRDELLPLLMHGQVKVKDV